MNRDDITRMARDCGWTPFESLSERFERFFQLAYEAGRKAEQDRCCAIVIGLSGSDNVAHRTVKAIRSDK